MGIMATKNRRNKNIKFLKAKTKRKSGKK